MKKKRKIDMYDPQIYPRKLWVAVGPEELDEQFKFYLTDKSGVIENIDEEFEQEGIAMSTYSVCRKSDGLYGCLVYAPNLEVITDDAIPHEAVHVADYFFEVGGIYGEDFSEGNEAYAYLVGWSAGNISKTIIDYERRRDKKQQERI